MTYNTEALKALRGKVVEGGDLCPLISLKGSLECQEPLVRMRDL